MGNMGEFVGCFSIGHGPDIIALRPDRHRLEPE